VERLARGGRGRRLPANWHGHSAGTRGGDRASGHHAREQHADRSHRTRKVASGIPASQFAESIGRS
jgi:hypothetical protein